jgi:putative intracellular protease/amidase
LLPSTQFATARYLQDTGVPGPTIMIVGGAHGNEPAGAAAAEIIRQWPISKGRVLTIPRANVPGLAARKRLIPNLDTNLNNLNRNYPRAWKDEPARGELATAIWELALKYKPDWLLDLHEGFDFHQRNNSSVGSSIIVYPNEQAKAAARLMLAAVNEDITDPGLRFVERDMPIDGSLARAGGEHLHIPSMTLETTSKQPMARRVQQHETMVRRLFQHLGLVGENLRAGPNHTEPVTRVALYKGPGTSGAGPSNLLAKLQHPPETTITSVTPAELASGILTNYDVVIFAGGSGSKQAGALGAPGRSAVRQFVASGGGYIGICAGAYLATSGYSWGLNLINARTISSKWQRGRGDVKMELTKSGRKILGEREGVFDVLYANGPIVTPSAMDDLPAMEVLAWFRSELAENGTPAGIMVDSPAIFSASYKLGRVVCISPHPEQTKGLEEFIPRVVTWVSPQQQLKRAKVYPE